MEYMNAEGPGLIPFPRIVRKTANQSPVHGSTREETWMLKENKLVHSPHALNSSSCDNNLPCHSLKRGIFTIHLPSTQILVANSTACKLLNYSPDELCSMTLENLIEEPHRLELTKLIEHINDASQGSSKKEKIVELISKDGDLIPASLFFKRIDSPQRFLAVIEPMDRKTAVVTVDNAGKILTCDEEAASMFQYEPCELIGADVRMIIPCIFLDSDGESKFDISYKQRLTGRNRNGLAFPLCLVISKNFSTQGSWQIVIWVFVNLSGLIILNKDLRISSCNHQFTKLLFGAPRDSVLNQKITKFIPTFCEDLKQMSRYGDESGRNDQSDTSSPVGERKKHRHSAAGTPRSRDRNPRRSDSKSFVEVLAPPGSGSRKTRRQNGVLVHGDHRSSWYKCSCKQNQISRESNLNIRLSKSDYDIRLGCDSNGGSGDERPTTSRRGEARLVAVISGPHGNESDGSKAKKKFGSEEFALKTKQKNEDCFDYKHFGLKEGYFSGNGKHWDGNDINIYYKVKIIAFGDKLFYCVWISRDPSEINDVSPNMPSTVTGSSSVNSNSMDDTATKDSSYSEELTRHSSASILSQNDEILTGGEYSENYTNIEQIGKGAFGYVKMAYRHTDGLLVVTKFIKKKKINAQSWVFDPQWSVKVPLEISLLTNLKHPNIIEVLDVFHNESFFQLVMKKHGAGMDLFEFIERKPNSDEKLNSYIFRQIVSAVQYLDSIGVLHRDIKDENVIINEKFEVKLIDFGSAAFKPPGKMFSIFYGTVEYCSPEVLQGNRYRGPELEIWALGVTLYVLIFRENPFYDAQETIKGQFAIPVPISSFLFDLIHKMLDKNVESRITIGRVATHPWITQPVDIDKYRFEDVVHCSAAEADPPRFVTEFAYDKHFGTDLTQDGDGDRTMASSNSFCSLQTTENTENFDQYDDNLQDFAGEFLTDDSVYKSSTPVSSGSSKNRDDLTKSAGALNRVCDNGANFKSPVCDRCSYKNFIKKRFSLDINLLKGLSTSSKCSDSDCSLEQVGGVESRDNFNEKLELDLISDMDEMKLAKNENGNKTYMYDTDAYSAGGGGGGGGGSARAYQSYAVDGDFGKGQRERTTSRETEESNPSAYPEFYDTSDSRSFDGEDSECFWDAENEKFRSSGDDY